MNRLSVGFRPGVADRLQSSVLGELLVGDPDPRKLLPYLGVMGAENILERAQQGCLLHWRTEFLTATPIGFGCPLPDFSSSPQGATLSRFALFRRDDDQWRLESGRTPWSITLLPEVAARLMAGHIFPDELDLLFAIGMLDSTDHEAAHWQFHERYFALRSQLSQPLAPPRRDTEPPPPLQRTRFPDSMRMKLPVLSETNTESPPHFLVTEERRTQRMFSPDPLPLYKLSQILWHTLRVVAEIPRDDSDHMSYTSLRRPIPSGGGMHAIDTWLYSREVEGLSKQWWWYDPFHHELVAVPTSGPVEPQPLPDAPLNVVLTAHHERVSWKYGSIAHSLELKDIGVIMHAIQLAAGACGVGTWLLGASNFAVVAASLGINAEVDVPLGELALGVVPQ